jgi:RND family efflux transporter MFP subunit
MKYLEKIKTFLKWLLAKKIRLAAAVIAILLISLFFWNRNRTKSQTPQIQTATVEKGTIVASISASGSVISSNIQNITTQASGVVSKVNVVDGEEVKKGQTIAQLTLDSSGEQNQASAYSSYLSAKSSLASANANYYTLQSDLFAKNQKLINDAVARGLTTDDPTYIQQNDDWMASEAKFKNVQTDLAKAQASLSSAWLSYQQTSAKIVAPSSGTVNSLTIAEGMTLGASQTTSGSRNDQRIASILTGGTPLISVNVSEIDVNSIKTGQKATITLDSLSDKTFTGSVVSVDRVGTTSNNVTTYPVVIKLDVESNEILPNMAASASIITETKTDVLTIPSSAINYQGSQATVTVVKGKTQEVTNIEVGISSDTQSEVVSGLSEGESIVTSSTTQTQTTQTSNSRGIFQFGGGGRPD